MKEIGEKLKEARESIGVSIEEAADDLKLPIEQIVNIENGDIENFNDVFYVKYFIRDYSKYLGLDKEDMIDEFNEYLFDYTSKISLDDIKNAKKEQVKEPDKVKSPYTIDRKKKVYTSSIVIYSLVVIVLIIILVVGYFIANNNKDDETIISYIQN